LPCKCSGKPINCDHPILNLREAVAQMKRVFNPSSVRPPFGQYNHGLLVPPGASLLVTSGQLGIRPDDSIPADVTAQAEICFEAIKAILEEAGMSFADVIRISGYVTRREDFSAYMAVRDRYTLEPKPVSTLIVVGGFTRPEFLVEVEVTAAKLA
jgi:2-iminobutanoate/2-iminopropanoate deaminase